MRRPIEDSIIRTFIKLVNESIDSNYIHALAALVKLDYYSCLNNFNEKRLNKLRKVQLHKVVMSLPSVRGNVMKNTVYMSKWLLNSPNFIIEIFLKCNMQVMQCAYLKIPSYKRVNLATCFVLTFHLAHNVMYSYIAMTIVFFL